MKGEMKKMDRVILYSTGCPKCEVLKKKLSDKNITYIEVNDKEQMIKMGMTEVPMVDIDGELKGFGEAVKWINSIGEK